MWRPATQPARLPGRSELTPSLRSLDAYGPLVDVGGGWREAFGAILRETGASRIDALEFWEHWEAANIRGYWQAYRPYREICRASLDETFRHFGLHGDPGLIRLYFDAFPAFPRFPDVDEVLDRLARRVRPAAVSDNGDHLVPRAGLRPRFRPPCTA